MTAVIEFRCGTCGKLLRTPEENAGRPAACPGCGDRLDVPTSGEPVFETSHTPPASLHDPHRSGAPRPHRGGPILALGILSWVMTCFLFGLFAWMLGVQDLRAMRAGEMDPTGEALTRVGMILGIVNVVLTAVVFLGVMSIVALSLLFA